MEHPATPLAPQEVRATTADILVRQVALQAEVISEHLNRQEAIHIVEVAQADQAATAPVAIAPVAIPEADVLELIPEADVPVEVIEAVDFHWETLFPTHFR